MLHFLIKDTSSFLLIVKWKTVDLLRNILIETRYSIFANNLLKYNNWLGEKDEKIKDIDLSMSLVYDLAKKARFKC